ncbi:MAG: S53 family peptidase [Streptosporangiaceae bacterium]|jgi:subtilase family serine protease
MHLNQISWRRPHAARPPGRRSRRWPWLAATTLTACLAAAYPAAAVAAGTAAAQPPRPLNCGTPDFLIQCYTPQAYEVAYGVAPLLRRGIDGRGETVVMPELAETPSHRGLTYTDIRQDLAAFDSKFGLPAAKLRVVNTIARSKAPYLAGTEEIEDTEMVHAIAPGASLDVVLVPQDAESSSANFAAAITKAIQAGVALHAAVISISASGGEHLLTPAEVAAMNAALEQARDQRVTVVAGSGDTGAISDNGPPQQVSLPASDPLVLAAGGTTLDANWATGAYLGEMAWNEGTEASGGGYSRLFPRSAYQDGVARIGVTRGVPDVAANADSATAMALDISGGGLLPASGTSAATPLWAGVIALADQQAGQHLGFVNPAIYAIARSPAYHQAFHDVVTGDNSVLWPTGVFTGYTAGPGWDPVTGWGSPNAQYLVPLLAHTTRSGV